MRNTIPCSAERLDLLEPAMIQSVVEATAFAWGSRYLTENRVRIVKANAVSIVSTVIGSSGHYEQSVELKNGMLATRCSCHSEEQPTCRHCIAVLLEYHRRSNPPSQKASPSTELKNGARAERDSTSPAAEINLRDLTVFVDWLQLTVSALSTGHPLPELPVLGSRQAQEWGRCIKDLEGRRCEIEAANCALETDLHAREEQISRLTEKLQASTRDLKAVQVASEAMQRELEQYRVIVHNLRDTGKHLEQATSQTKGLADNLAMQKSLLDNLSALLRRSSASLDNLPKH